jgi:hypothetical protein
MRVAARKDVNRFQAEQNTSVKARSRDLMAHLENGEFSVKE